MLSGASQAINQLQNKNKKKNPKPSGKLRIYCIKKLE